MPKTPSLKSLIEAYLQEARLMQVATSIKNQPWVCTVYFAFDKTFDLFWISKPESRHSKELEYNHKVAGTIVLPHTPGDDVRGIQFQGKAKRVRTKRGMADAMQYYAKRYDLPKTRVAEIIAGSDGHACYRISPSLFILYDETNFPDDPRQEYQL